MGVVPRFSRSVALALATLACAAPQATPPDAAPAERTARAPVRRVPSRSPADEPASGRVAVTGVGFGADLETARSKAVSDAYAEAARRRGTRVQSWIRDAFGSQGDDRFQSSSIQDAALLLAGAVLGEPRVRREGDGLLVEIDLSVPREQLDPGAVIAELARRPDARDALTAFATRAAARDDVEAAAMAHEHLLRNDPRADDLLHMAGLHEQQGDLPAAVALLDRWRPRLPTDDPRVAALRESLADRLVDPAAEVDNLLAAARRSAHARLRLATDRSAASVHDPVRLTGQVPTDRTLALLWFDAASVALFEVLDAASLAEGRIDKRIDYLDPATGRADPTGFVPGEVHLLVLAVDGPLSPPPTVDLAACARDDMGQRQRLRTLVRTVEALLRREGTEAQVLDWLQTDPAQE